MSDATQQSSDTKFMRVFIPGLVVGLLVGMAIGAFLPPLLEQGPRLPVAPAGGVVAPDPGANRDPRPSSTPSDRSDQPLEDPNKPATKPTDPENKPLGDPAPPSSGDRPN